MKNAWEEIREELSHVWHAALITITLIGTIATAVFLCYELSN